MPRLNEIHPDQATGTTSELYSGITAKIGGVPNIYRGIANSPAALGAVLQLGGALHNGTLSTAEQEAIKLLVSQTYGCDYCLAAHTLLGKKAGLTEGQTISARRGLLTPDNTGVLLQFIKSLLRPEASTQDVDLVRVRTAGYTDAQITEALLAVAQTVFTNLFNRVHQTALDFPPAPAA